MAGIRFTKVEREYLRTWLEATGVMDFGAKGQKAKASILAKLDKAEAPKASGLDVKAAVEAFRGVLGSRLILPMGAVWGMMQNRIRALGLTEEDCRTIATVAASDWQGKVKAESLVRQAEKLLSESSVPASAKSTPRGRRGALEMDDL